MLQCVARAKIAAWCRNMALKAKSLNYLSTSFRTTGTVCSGSTKQALLQKIIQVSSQSEKRQRTVCIFLKKNKCKYSIPFLFL